LQQRRLPVLDDVRAPTIEQLHQLLDRIIKRIMKLLTRQGYLIEEEGMSYLNEIDADRALTPRQAASCTYRIVLGPRAGQKVLSLQTVPGTTAQAAQALCAAEHIIAAQKNCASCSTCRRKRSSRDDHGY
jgi:hypothetical protein